MVSSMLRPNQRMNADTQTAALRLLFGRRLCAFRLTLRCRTENMKVVINSSRRFGKE